MKRTKVWFWLGSSIVSLITSTSAMAQPTIIIEPYVLPFGVTTALLDAAQGGQIDGKASTASPISAYTVAVISDRNGAVRQATIESGEFRLDEVPLGSARFTVHTHAPAPGMTPPGMEVLAGEQPASLALPVPARYGDPARSGLTLEVQPSEQTFDLELTQ